MNKQFDCELLKHEGVVESTCCDSCHDQLRYDTKPISVLLPSDEWANVCCHVERALRTQYRAENE
jgi:hypothetical protein